ncbi:hypothetical protein [Celeribacter sp. PS-C1]|uniref:hypothetical protein n=1 Tax=Celeribacter sp. PS-C1 TaxID=2820813 RepID=UPI001CA5C886|nr:hypothetical protein [Celeribacter sp. PS-C1]MBW6417302.1 hypothetical protein [Celeribacter sp. PS-C1]
MIETLDPNQNYFICTPLLSECARIQATAKIAIQQPEIIDDVQGHETKKEHLIQLLRERKSVVTTHAMFDQLTDVANAGLLEGYNIIIDEVLSVVDDGYRVKEKTWEELYVGAGYVEIDPTSGLITPTAKWEADVEQIDDALKRPIFNAAGAERLYHVNNGINLAVMPEALLRAGKSLTVYTYKAKGSLMLAYLNRLRMTPSHDKGSPKIELDFLRDTRKLITVRDIPSLSGLKLSYSGQTSTAAKALNDKVSRALKSLRQNALRDIPLENILITCPKEKWFYQGKAPIRNQEGVEQTKFLPGPYAKASRLAPTGYNKRRAIWLPNTTRGTNDYRHCTHAIYLYDQYLNPNIHRWIGGNSIISQDDYALTELIQWVWRTQIRDKKPITLYLPSKRMRELFLSWLWEGDIPTEVKAQAKGKHRKAVP